MAIFSWSDPHRISDARIKSIQLYLQKNRDITQLFWLSHWNDVPGNRQSLRIMCVGEKVNYTVIVNHVHENKFVDDDVDNPYYILGAGGWASAKSIPTAEKANCATSAINMSTEGVWTVIPGGWYVDQPGETLSGRKWLYKAK